MQTGDACREMAEGEILNAHLSNLPLHKCTIYGDKVLSKKLSKRLSCAIKHLPIRLQFNYNHNTQDAIELGIAKDPTMVLDGKIFIEGLIQAEDITRRFEEMLHKGEGRRLKDVGEAVPHNQGV